MVRHILCAHVAFNHEALKLKIKQDMNEFYYHLCTLMPAENESESLILNIKISRNVSFYFTNCVTVTYVL